MDISTTSIRRIIPATDVSRMVALNLSILTNPWCLDEVEAIAPLPGLGEPRIKAPVELYDKSQARYLIIGGANDKEKTYEELNALTLRRPEYGGLQRTDGILTKAVTSDTRDQIDYVMKEVRRHNIRSIAIFTSPYHLVRAFGTAIKALERLDMVPIPIIPISLGSLDDPIPESYYRDEVQTGHDMVAGEIKRFFDYGEKGDVAGYGQIKDFIEWMRDEHPAMAMAA